MSLMSVLKKGILLLLACLLMVGTAACGAVTEEPEDGRLQIIATVFPAYDFARQIAGEHANVRLLVPPGSETHSFEPTPADMIRLQSADLILCNGGESEAWMEEILESLEGSVNVLRMMDCVAVVEEEEKEGMQSAGGAWAQEEEEEDEGPEYDEHVWTSPVNAIEIAEALAEALCTMDPENAADYRASQAAFRLELENLDRQFREVVAAARSHTLIFADRFPVRYFTEEYGLDYYAAFSGCADDAEPSAKTVAFLIDRVREEQVPAVLYIEFSNQKMADVICEDTGCGKRLFHSCHNVSVEDLNNGVTYLELMQKNVESVREALG